MPPAGSVRKAVIVTEVVYATGNVTTGKATEIAP